MTLRASAGVCCALALLGGCGASKPAPVPAACLQPPAAIARALERAPAPVRLTGDVPLSRCVGRARADGDLESIGVSLTEVADGLSARATTNAAAALQLGYLVGAARRGAAATPGIGTQLARRLESTVPPTFASDAARLALRRGIGLGEAGG